MGRAVSKHIENLLRESQKKQEETTRMISKKINEKARRLDMLIKGCK